MTGRWQRQDLNERYTNLRFKCEPAILKSYFMCTFYLIKLPLCDIKITLDSEKKCKLFSGRAQQKKWPIQSLIEKREGKIV